MQIQRINITLPISILKELQKTVPSGKRSRFIADAVLGKLKQANIQSELKKSLKANRELYLETSLEWENSDFETWPN